VARSKKETIFANKFLPPHSTAEGVSRYLEEAIICGDLKPGSRLIERDLAETLGVSRIPIREAFRILEIGGLVKTVPRRGAQVTAIHRQEVEDIFTIRANLIGLAAKLAARNAAEKDILRLSQITQDMVEKAKRKNLRSYFRLNVKFHALLGQASGNNHLATILENLGKQTFRFRYLSLSLPGRIQQTLKNHRRLIGVIRARKEGEAEKIARGNIEEAKEILLQYISAHPEFFHPGNKNSAPRLRK